MSDFGEIKSFRDKSDFSFENRHLICISNKEFINKNVVLLFYKKSDRKDKQIYEIFSKVGNSLKIINLNFVSCAVDTIPGLEKTFQEIASDPDHPYHWIRNKPKNEEKDGDLSGNVRFPFILIYRKGFPQCFYEGPLEESEFRDYCIQLTVKSDFVNQIQALPEEIIKQQWMEYRVKEKEEPKGKAIFDAFNTLDYNQRNIFSSFFPSSPKK
jgi:hypothetical protein